MHTCKRPLLRRLIVIDRELRSNVPPTAVRLAQLCEVDDKTIRRDLAYLREQYGAPVEYIRSCNGWRYTEPTYTLPAVLITAGELLAMFVAGQALQHYVGTPYEHDLQRAIRKLEELLPDEISMHWNAIEQAHSFRQSVTTLRDVDLFRQLADAVLHHRQLKITYWTASRDSVSERVIDPWHLAFVDGEPFLVAWCHTRREARTFSPARIRAISETGQAVVVPDDFHIGEFFDGSFRVIREEGQPAQTVRLRFAPSAAKYIREKVWHASQRLHMKDDGSAVLELDLRSLIEVRRWVLSWGSECEVLAPAELRADIAREAAAILNRTPATMPRSTRVRKQSRAG